MSFRQSISFYSASHQVFDEEVSCQALSWELASLRKNDGAEDLLWELPHVEQLYELVCKHFDVGHRFDVLEKKIEHSGQSCRTYNEHVRHQHSAQLEWWIIYLITIEIFLSLYEIVFHNRVENILAHRDAGAPVMKEKENVVVPAHRDVEDPGKGVAAANGAKAASSYPSLLASG